VSSYIQNVGDALILLELTACSPANHSAARRFVGHLMSAMGSLLRNVARSIFVGAPRIENMTDPSGGQRNPGAD
jgi:hypothetical protein